MKNLNNKGFSLVEGLLIFVVLTIIGGTGYYVYNANKKVNDGTSGTTIAKQEQGQYKPKVTPDKPKVSEQTYLEINQWGVKIPTSDSVKGLEYKIEYNTSKQGQTAKFRSNSLDSSGTKGCESNSINVARGKAGEYIPNEIGSNTTTYKTQFENVKNNPGSYPASSTVNIKIGSYYYVTPGYRGASCVASNNKNLLAPEQKATTNIISAVNKMIAI